MKANVNEQGWSELFHEGDNAALSYFFKLHYKSLCYFVDQMIHNDLESEDIVSGCFVKAWERRQHPIT